MSNTPTRYCDICKQPILKYQSWHADGSSLNHLACEHHRSPADHEGYSRWTGDPNLMIVKRKHVPHTKDGRAKNVPPHERAREAKSEM